MEQSNGTTFRRAFLQILAMTELPLVYGPLYNHEGHLEVSSWPDCLQKAVHCVHY